MTRNLLLLCLLLLFIKAGAQDTIPGNELTLKLGLPTRSSDGYTPLGFFVMNESNSNLPGYVQFSYMPGKELLILAFDSNMKFIKENVIQLKELPPDFSSVSISKFGNNFYWFLRSYDELKDEQVLWAQQIDIDNGKLAGKCKAIIKSTAIVSKYISRVSRDKTKMLFCYRMKHKFKSDRINKEEIGFFVFDPEFKVITDTIIEMPLTEDLIDNKDYLVDNQGNAYILVKIFDYGRSPAISHKPNYHYEVFMLKAGTKRLHMIDLKLHRMFYYFAFIAEEANGDMVIGGLYSKDDRIETKDGLFVTTLLADGSIKPLGYGYFDFSKDVLEQFMPEYDYKYWQHTTIKGGEAKYLVMRNFSLQDDGGIDLLCEVYYFELASYADMYFGELLHTSIDGNGKLKWMKVIPKRQVGVNGRRSLSFNYFKAGDDSYLVFADKNNNLNLAPGEKPEMYVEGKAGCMSYTKIDKQGTVTKRKMFDFKKGEAPFNPADLVSTENNCLVGTGRDKQSPAVFLLKVNAGR